MSKKKPSPCLLCDCACGVTCNCDECTCTNGPCATSSAVRVAAYVTPMPKATDAAPHPLADYTNVLIEREGLTWAVSMVDLSMGYSPVIPRPFTDMPDIYTAFWNEQTGRYWLNSNHGPIPIDEHNLKVMRARYIVWEQQQVMRKPGVQAELDRVMQIMGSMDGAYMPLTPDATGLTPLIIPMGTSEEEEAAV